MGTQGEKQGKVKYGDDRTMLQWEYCAEVQPQDCSQGGRRQAHHLPGAGRPFCHTEPQAERAEDTPGLLLSALSRLSF